jgi:hypothetical protein
MKEKASRAAKDRGTVLLMSHDRSNEIARRSEANDSGRTESKTGHLRYLFMCPVVARLGVIWGGHQSDGLQIRYREREERVSQEVRDHNPVS